MNDGADSSDGAQTAGGGNIVNLEAVRESIGRARTVTPALPHGFEMKPEGLFLKEKGERKEFRICGPFEIVAETRPADQKDWGLLVRHKDADDHEHEWIIPRRLLAGDGTEVRTELAARGLYVGAHDGARSALRQFFSEVRTPARVRTVPATGWYRPQTGGDVFVLPGRIIGAGIGETVRLDADPLPRIYAERGTLDEWREHVSLPCRGNSRMIFAVSCAFAGPLLELAGDESGGVHFRGGSSKGKTTLLDLAASVWGAPTKTGRNAFARQWNMTASALENTAQEHNHTLLPLDEISQVDGARLAQIIYNLFNGTAKGRSRAAGGNRPGAAWSIFMLSTGEQSAASLIEAAGSRMKAGAEVRLLDVPAEIPGAFGVFDNLHETADGAMFARQMRDAVVAQHGTAGPAFLEWLTARLHEDRDFASADLTARVKVWCDRNVPRGADGQVKRAGRRLGLIAAAGELATAAGCTGWEPGEAERAAGILFQDWIAERGGIGSREDHHLFKRFRQFIGQDSGARFAPIGDADGRGDGGQVEPPIRVEDRTVKRAGWKWEEVDEAGRRVLVFGIIPEVFDAEIAGPLSMDGKEARNRLGAAGLIRGFKEAGRTRWTSKSQRIPHFGRPRLVVTDGRILEGGTDE